MAGRAVRCAVSEAVSRVYIRGEVRRMADVAVRFRIGAVKRTDPVASVVAAVAAMSYRKVRASKRHNLVRVFQGGKEAVDPVAFLAVGYGVLVEYG